MMPPTVAFELAPLGAPDTVEDGLSRAERMLRSGEKKMPRAGEWRWLSKLGGGGCGGRSSPHIA